jgi:hypothetical protein
MSCEKWIDPEINTDPDNPKDAAPSVILPACQSELAFYLGGFEGAGPAAIFMQQVKGADCQAKAYDNYSYKESDANNLWDGFFTGFMIDIKSIIDGADAAKAANFKGVGQVLMALSLGNATDMFGDIPYTEALQGAANLTPKFDTQQEIYATINTLLTDAIANLSNTNPGDNNLAIGADFYYDGDYDQWLMAAYTLRARYEMHQVKVKTVNFTNVIADLDAGIMAIGDDMEQPFGTGSAEWNPMYNFTKQRSGYVAASSVFSGFLEGDTLTYLVADPRAGSFKWGGGFWTSAASSVALVQATEAMFLKAEAQWRNAAYADARTTLKDAVAMSLDKYGVSGAAWTTAFEADVDAAADADLLELIMNQKYRHMYCQPEAWTDWRRTGFPVLSPVVGSDIPRRLPYATDERTYNGNNVPDYGTIFSRVWWDKL